MKFRLSFLLLAIVVLSSCTSTPEQKNRVQRVKCEEVKSVCDMIISVSYPGKVTAAADVNLSFRVAGVVEQVEAREGQFVKEGEVVARLDSRDYKLQLDATQAEYDAIKGEVGRVVTLYYDNSIPKNDYEKAVSGLKQITSKLSAHRNAYEDTQLKAPFDGYIQKVNFDKGEALSAGMPIVKFVSASAPEVVVNLPVVEYLRRAELLSASAVLSNHSDAEFELELIGISHKSNLNQLYEARFRVKPNGGVYPALGVSTMVSLNYPNSTASQVVIPFSAIVERDSKSYVWQIVGGVAQLSPVEIAKINNDGTATLSSGVVAGESVISAGVNSLKEGMKVEPISEPSKSNIGNIL
ncbi:MAG: efflux RND transporter periplasmic adaptor subunit [Rikenellaceae bacterium]